MAEKKPRKVKDLKARLGKTIAPNQKKGGGDVSAPADSGAVPAPKVAPAPSAAVPAPSLGGGAPAPNLPGAAPKAKVQGTPFAPAPPEPEVSAGPSDPFAAAAPSAAAGPREVRLVVDESPVADSEVGRKKSWIVFAMLGLGAIVGIVVGVLFGNTNTQNRMWNMGVRSGKEVYDDVRTAGNTLNQAQGYIDSAASASAGGPGKAPSVDYSAIEALVALENPMSGDTFTRQNYNLFKESTVSDLFSYYQNVNQIWAKIQTLNYRTSGEQNRERLDSSLEAAGNVARPIGCIPDIVDDQFACGLVFLFPNEGGEPGTVRAASRPNAPVTRQAEKAMFTGQDDLLESPSNYVIQVNNQRSVGVLGQQASTFGEYQALLNQLKALIDETVEIQARLETDLGQLNSYEERFALFDSGSNTPHGSADEE